MIDEVMFEIREMTGQDYRNHYAGEKVERRRVPVAPGRRRHRPVPHQPGARACRRRP